MGFTPLEGLVMGSRSGDIDPGILLYLLNEHHYDAEELDHLLNHQSGLKGLCGTNDMKIIIRKMQNGEENAKLAFDIFCQRIKQYIGAYIALLGNVDAIVFSGGIGANSPEVREAVCSNMAALGIILDNEKNQKDLTLIGDKGHIKILRIETDEEFEMADQSLKIIKKRDGNT
jgi:acetate kinase